jgi:hypothetical protein
MTSSNDDGSSGALDVSPAQGARFGQEGRHVSPRRPRRRQRRLSVQLMRPDERSRVTIETPTLLLPAAPVVGEIRRTLQRSAHSDDRSSGCQRRVGYDGLCVVALRGRVRRVRRVGGDGTER